MFLDERREKILDLLHKNGKVFVKDLAESFGVGEGMIRKDLQALEKDGKLKRTYGGAINKNELVHSSTLQERIEKFSPKRELIAQKLMNTLKDGDTIFLDISSTNYIFAQNIARSTKKILVITNMPNISTFFLENSYQDLILVGGTYNKRIGGVIGIEAINSINNYRIDKAYIGSCGLNFETLRVTNFDLEDGNTKKAIIKASNELYLLAETDKFGIEGFYSFANLVDFHFMVTEEKIAPQQEKVLKEFGIELM